MSRLLTDAELIAVYASQGLTIGENASPGFMGQHVRGLRQVAELALAATGPAKPIAVLHPSVMDKDETIRRLEDAGYVVVWAHAMHHVIVRSPKPSGSDTEPVAGDDVMAWHVGDTLTDVHAFPMLPGGMEWRRRDKDTWVVCAL